MWQPEGMFTCEGSSTATSFANGVHVLLVDHDKDLLFSTTKMLESLSYKVTTVEHASTALAILSQRNMQFDIMMVDINSPEMEGFNLLQKAVNMDILTILMSGDDEVSLTSKALENGAFLCLDKPVSIGMLKCLWQHVERKRKEKKKYKNNGKVISYENETKKVSTRKTYSEDCRADTNNLKNKGVKRNTRSKRATSKNENPGLENNNTGRVKRKSCTEWTTELHEKFVDAVRELGEGRCYPKEILQLMNVPGLTRMQVASHLQKCRNDNWRAPDERKSHSSGISSPSCDSSQTRICVRKFGSMPCFNNKRTTTPPSQLQENNGPYQAYSPTTFNNFERNESEDNFRQLLTLSQQNLVTQFPNSIDPSIMVLASDYYMKENEELEIGLGLAANQNYGPVYNDLNNATVCGSCYTNLSNSRPQSDDLFDCIPEMDDFIQNFAEFPNASVVNHGSMTANQCFFHKNQVLP